MEISQARVASWQGSQSFLNTLEPSSGWLPGNFEIRSRTFRILRDSGLSKTLLKNIYSKDTYWAKMGNQLFLRRNEKGDLLSFGTIHVYPLVHTLIYLMNRYLLPIRMRLGYWCQFHQLHTHSEPDYLLLHQLSYSYRFSLERHCRNQATPGSPRLPARFASCRRLSEAVAARYRKPSWQAHSLCPHCFPS